jgi:hypothetical protein
VGAGHDGFAECCEASYSRVAALVASPSGGIGSLTPAWWCGCSKAAAFCGIAGETDNRATIYDGQMTSADLRLLFTGPDFASGAVSVAW